MSSVRTASGSNERDGTVRTGFIACRDRQRIALEGVAVSCTDPYERLVNSNSP
jgi:hypothetical protein